MAELARIMNRFSTAEGVARALSIPFRPSDVFIATFPKSGTTLMQQIVHGLRTGGDMDFRDISEVIPWLELTTDLGQDPAAPQRAEPRVYKTHLDRAQLPRTGRSIYLVREPEATLMSFYDFFSGWIFEPGAISLESFALDYLFERGGHRDYWNHLCSWWSHRADVDVLYLFYEDVVADLPAAVARVARLLEHATGSEFDAARIEVAVRGARRDYMQRFPDRWDDALVRERRNPAMGLPPDARSTKVRAAAATRRSEARLTDRVRDVLRARWARDVEPLTGCADYASLRTRGLD